MIGMLERRKPLDLLFPLQGNAKSRESGMDTQKMTTLDRLRAVLCWPEMPSRPSA